MTDRSLLPAHTVEAGDGDLSWVHVGGRAFPDKSPLTDAELTVTLNIDAAIRGRAWAPKHILMVYRRWPRQAVLDHPMQT
jgi:hypothetical protein